MTNPTPEIGPHDILSQIPTAKELVLGILKNDRVGIDAAVLAMTDGNGDSESVSGQRIACLLVALLTQSAILTKMVAMNGEIPATTITEMVFKSIQTLYESYLNGEA